MSSEIVKCGHCGAGYHFSDDHYCVPQMKLFREFDDAIIKKLENEVESLALKVEWLEKEMETDNAK